MKHFAWALVLISSLLSTVNVLASCGSSYCALDPYSPFRTQKGQVTLGYMFEYIDQNTPRIGTERASVGELAGHHDEIRSINRIHRFNASWDATDRLSLDTTLPVVSRSHSHVHHHHGAAIYDEWKFTGMGDFTAQARYAFYKPEDAKKPMLSMTAGMEFPTGETHITNSGGAEAEPGITPGSGSYDVIVGLSALQHANVPMLNGADSLLPIFVSTFYKMNGEGHDDYKLGNILSANAGVIYPLLSWLGLQTQLNAIVKERDDRGLTNEEIGKTGGEYLYLSPGLTLHVARDLDFNTLFQIPVYQRVNQIQLTSDYNLQAGISYRFKI